MKTGSFKLFLANSINHLILTHPHTQTAHSGNIQSLQTLFNSSLTKYNISSYLAVTIFERYTLEISPSSHIFNSFKLNSLSIYH
jgi:hypothetical protein